MGVDSDVGDRRHLLQLGCSTQQFIKDADGLRTGHSFHDPPHAVLIDALITAILFGIGIATTLRHHFNSQAQDIDQRLRVLTQQLMQVAGATRH